MKTETNKKGEMMIINMFNGHPHDKQQLNRAAVQVNPASDYTPRPRMNGGLNDKVKLFKTLGFAFNERGDQIPAHKSTGNLIYKMRLDTSSFLGGILTQKDRSNPLLSSQVMWVENPSRSRVRPSIWFVHKHGDFYKGMMATPDVMRCNVEERREGRAEVQFWYCTRWNVKAAVVPQKVTDVLDTVNRKSALPSYITVDCLDDRVFDIHGRIEIDALDFDKDWTLDLQLYHNKERPFFDLDIETVTKSPASI